MSYTPEDTVDEVIQDMINDGSLDVNDIDGNAEIFITVVDDIYSS